MLYDSPILNSGLLKSLALSGKEEGEMKLCRAVYSGGAARITNLY